MSDNATGDSERVTLDSRALDLLDQYRDDDGGRGSYNDVIHGLLTGQTRPCELVGCTNPAETVEDIGGKEHANLVCNDCSLDTDK